MLTASSAFARAPAHATPESVVDRIPAAKYATRSVLVSTLEIDHESVKLSSSPASERRKIQKSLLSHSRTDDGVLEHVCRVDFSRLAADHERHVMSADDLCASIPSPSYFSRSRSSWTPPSRFDDQQRLRHRRIHSLSSLSNLRAEEQLLQQLKILHQKQQQQQQRQSQNNSSAQDSNAFNNYADVLETLAEQLKPIQHLSLQRPLSPANIMGMFDRYVNVETRHGKREPVIRQPFCVMCINKTCFPARIVVVVEHVQTRGLQTHEFVIFPRQTPDPQYQKIDFQQWTRILSLTVVQGWHRVLFMERNVGFAACGKNMVLSIRAPTVQPIHPENEDPQQYGKFDVKVCVSSSRPLIVVAHASSNPFKPHRGH
jgi:hypothetical protein